jgi:hypothetical protein
MARSISPLANQELPRCRYEAAVVFREPCAWVDAAETATSIHNQEMAFDDIVFMVVSSSDLLPGICFLWAGVAILRPRASESL